MVVVVVDSNWDKYWLHGLDEETLFGDGGKGEWQKMISVFTAREAAQRIKGLNLIRMTQNVYEK